MGRTGWNTKVIVSQKWVYMRLKNNTRKGKTKSKTNDLSFTWRNQGKKGILNLSQYKEEIIKIRNQRNRK